MNISCVHGIVYYDVQQKVDVLTFTFEEKVFSKATEHLKYIFSGNFYYNVQGGSNFESLNEILQLKA